MELGGQSHVPGDLPSEKESGTNLQEAVWNLGPISKGLEKRQSLVPYRGFKLQTFQHVASSYTVYAIPAPKQDLDNNILSSGYWM